MKKEDSENEADNVTQDEDEPDEEEVDKSTKRKRCEPKVSDNFKDTLLIILPFLPCSTLN